MRGESAGLDRRWGTPKETRVDASPLRPHCWRKKVGLNMTWGSHTHMHTHSVSATLQSICLPACWHEDLSGHWAFLMQTHTHTHTDTHTKTLPINACRKFITDTDTAHYASTLRTAKICQTTNRMIFSFLTQTLQFNMQVHLLNKVF